MSGLGGFIMANQTVTVDAKQPWSGLVKKNQVLTIKDTHGQQAIDFLCYDADNTSDRYSATNTVKVQGNVYVRKGTVLYADSGKPLLSVIETLLEDTTQSTDVAAIPITSFVTVWRQPSRVIQTSPKSVKNMAWMSSRSFQT